MSEPIAFPIPFGSALPEEQPITAEIPAKEELVAIMVDASAQKAFVTAKMNLIISINETDGGHVVSQNVTGEMKEDELFCLGMHLATLCKSSELISQGFIVKMGPEQEPEVPEGDQTEPTE